MLSMLIWRLPPASTYSVSEPSCSGGPISYVACPPDTVTVPRAVMSPQIAISVRSLLIVSQRKSTRGPIVIEPDLLEILKAGKIHAALDVYEREPLPADHPLRKLDNVTLSPHLGYVHDDNYRLFYGDTVENVAAWMAGKPLRVINP